MLLALLDLIKELFVFAGYVSTKSGLPRQLSPEREQELLRLMAEGDDETSAAAKDELIEHDLRLVAHIAKKYRHGRDIDDLISIGSIGLIKAVNTYSPARGRSLAAYAARCIENEILMSIRAEKKRAADVSLSEPIGVDREGNEITVGDVLSDGSSVCDDVERSINAQLLNGVVSNMDDPRERSVIVLRYGLDGGDPLPQREVGKLLGISRSYVSRIEKKALEGLRTKLEQLGAGD